MVKTIKIFRVCTILNWFTTYLSNRPLKIVFNGATSKQFFPLTGVPQGSILGPLLFLIYIDDLSTSLTTVASLYADDLKTKAVIENVNNCNQLQDDIHSLNNWCTQNSLPLNTSKCCVMTYTSRTNEIQNIYQLNGQALERVSNFKDLGVLFDSKLKFNEHHKEITQKAFKMLGFLYRTARYFQSIESILLLYKSLVRSQLEYATTVWSPSTKTYSDAIEKVQRKFTRFVYRKFQIPYQHYEDRLITLQLPSLRRRRIEIDFKYLYKIINGNIATTCISEISIRLNRKNVRNMNLFGVRKYSTELGKKSPFPRMMNQYNELMNNVYLFNIPISEYMKIIHLKLNEN